MAEYVKFHMPEELKARQNDVLRKLRKNGKIRIGANEATKASERGTAKLIIIAEDVNPPEIVMHLPIVCKEKNIAFSYASTKKELGEAVGISVGTAAIAVIEEGDAKKDFEDFIKKIQEAAK